MNLDTLQPDELESYSKACMRLCEVIDALLEGKDAPEVSTPAQQVVTVAFLLGCGPSDLEYYKGVVKELGNYADFKRFAIKARRRGDVPRALKYETSADASYMRLPETYRW